MTRLPGGAGLRYRFLAGTSAAITAGPGQDAVRVAKEVGVVMPNGTVVRFNEANGYGFITPDDGSDDVFLHASLLDGEYRDNIPRGTRVAYEAVHSERGPKAVSVTVIATTRVTPAAARPTGGRGDDQDDQLCDVISTAEFSQKVTEVLIGTVPTITGGQIMEVRTRLLKHARRHGWIED